MEYYANMFQQKNNDECFLERCRCPKPRENSAYRMVSTYWKIRIPPSSPPEPPWVCPARELPFPPPPSGMSGPSQLGTSCGTLPAPWGVSARPVKGYPTFLHWEALVPFPLWTVLPPSSAFQGSLHEVGLQVICVLGCKLHSIDEKLKRHISNQLRRPGLSRLTRLPLFRGQQQVRTPVQQSTGSPGLGILVGISQNQPCPELLWPASQWSSALPPSLPIPSQNRSQSAHGAGQPDKVKEEFGEESYPEFHDFLLEFVLHLSLGFFNRLKGESGANAWKRQ